MNNIRDWFQFIFRMKTEEKPQPKIEEPKPAPAPQHAYRAAQCGTPGCMCHMPSGRMER